MNIPQEVLYPLEAAMEQWTDKRIIDDSDLEDVLLFLLYGPIVLSQNGQRLDGYTFRHKKEQWLLTVKVKEGQTPLVVFITAATPTACVRRFWSLYDNDRLSYVRDKYPWI